jgi:hypothetical protein
VDELDRIILESHNKIVIESLSFASGSKFNTVRIEWSVPQDDAVLAEHPMNRLTQWAIEKRFHNPNRQFTLNLIPSTIDADEIALWLAKQFKAQGKQVQLSKWVAPMCFKKIEV